ncbi:GreA/GreB family elongation factor [Paenibacillus sp. J2TS4]|uniref:GreA/GreB family elongation factor n=1 Tax=Paenibacillus sp. J2TS4 TaxID=2807194 RepID=UPI001AFE368C|nr:GreA/GreB family elongation factor [Paenibacillus sp. J2TS4]GIP34091.1 hypothetical protein J2TS4_33010 [Paenibacillus sp. J2TS4]
MPEHGSCAPRFAMDSRTAEQIRTRLIDQLVFFDEQQMSVLDTYFPSASTEPQERSATVAWMDQYVSELEQIVFGLAGNSPDLPPKVLIGSTVTLRQPADNERKTYKICLPDDADPSTGNLSFLSPIGMQLLLASLNETVHLPALPGVSETMTDSIISDIRFEEEELRK